MPGQSTGRDLHIDVPLSTVAMKYRPEGMIFDQIAPSVNVPKQHDSYYVWDIGDVFRVIDDYRAPGDEAKTMTRKLSSDTFFCKNHVLKYPVPYEDIENADAKELFVARNMRAEAILDQLYLNSEYRVAQLCTSGSNCGSYSTVASAWNDATEGNSDPIGDIDTAIDNVEGGTGIRPNSVVFGRNTWKSFKRHAAVVKAIYGNTGDTGGGKARVPTAPGVKALFEFERVVIGGAYYNSAAENQTTSLSALWDDVCLVYYAPMVARRDKASFMYTFDWSKVKGMNRQAQVFDEPKKGREDVQVGFYSDEKITASGLSFLITGCNSSQ